MSRTARTEWKKGTPLDQDTQARLRCLIAERGEAATAKLLQASIVAVTRGAAGCNLRRGTALVLESGLTALSAMNAA